MVPARYTEVMGKVPSRAGRPIMVESSKKKEPSEFVRLVEKDWGGHFPIPPGAKTYNSDVEAFHQRIEEEFYWIEPINSYSEFFGKAKTYIRWFNYQRNNYYKDGSPLKLLKESKENAYAEGQETSRDSYPPEIFNLTPLAGQAVLLDNYVNKTTGYNLPVKYI